MIKSPIGGTVGLLQVSAGNAVSAQTTVTTVEKLRSIRVLAFGASSVVE